MGLTLTALLLVSFAVTISTPAQSINQNSWSSTYDNNPPLYYPNCFAIQGFIYCIGGGAANFTSAALINQNGSLDQWFTLPGFPENESYQSCAYSKINSYIMCVGGYAHHLPANYSSNSTNSTNSTNHLSGLPPAYGPQQTTYIGKAYNIGTLGAWGFGQEYPFTPFLSGCAATGTYLYCVGGYNLTVANSAVQINQAQNPFRISNTVYKSNLTNAVYYTQIRSNESLGNWSATTNYPIAIGAQQCLTSDTYIYCIGGLSRSGNSDSVYYAKIGSSGALGSWLQATSYPITISSQGCATADNKILCVGGLTGKSNISSSSFYYATIEHNGSLSQWSQLPNYPLFVSGESCTAYNITMFCVGGFSRQQGRITSSVYSFNITYARPSNSTSITTTIPSNTTSISNVSNTTTSITNATTIPTITVVTHSTSTSTIIQTYSPGSDLLSIIIIAFIIIAAVAYYLYTTRRAKQSPNKPASQQK